MKKHLLKHALLALYLSGSACLVFAQNLSFDIIAQQDFNGIEEAQSESFDQLTSGKMLTNSGSIYYSNETLGFRTYWTDTRDLGTGPIHSDSNTKDLSDFIGVNSFSGLHSPDVSPEGNLYHGNEEQNFEFNDGDGRLELIFDPVELNGYVNRKLTLYYWINEAEYEDGDVFQVKVIDGINFHTALSYRAISLNQQACADDGTSNWRKLEVNLDELIDKGFKELLTLVIAVDNNASDENIFIDQVAFSGTPVASSCTDIFISEYISGGQFENCLELFNPTREAIDLQANQYQLKIYVAGQNRALNTIQLKGVVEPGETLVLCDASIHPDFKEKADVLIYEPFFKRGSVVELMHKGLPIDVVGQVGKLTDLGKEISLRRRSNITQGENSNMNAFVPAKEWMRLSKLSTRDLGRHLCDCQTEPCLINDMEVIITSACNDNNTPGPLDDFVVGDVIVHYSGKPMKGLLRLEGGTQAEIGVGKLGATSFRFKDVPFPADGQPIAVTGYFTEWDGCKKTVENLAMAPWACSEQTQRDLKPVDNTFVYEPLNEEQITPDPQNISTPQYKKYGTPSNYGLPFSQNVKQEAASFPVTSLSFKVTEPCMGSGTATEVDDKFLGEVTVQFSNIPSFGYLKLSGKVDVSVPVEHLKGNSYTFQYLELPANGRPFYVHAKFSASTQKQDKETALFQAPDPCSGSKECSELFISEYVEGSRNNRCLELYNPSSYPINLASENYQVRIFFNGGSQAGAVIPLKGTINGQTTFVLCDDDVIEEIIPLANQLSSLDFFTGDDAVVLSKGDEVLDVIGQVGFDPGFSWRAGLISTKNQTLRRKVLVKRGQQNNGFELANEWQALGKNSFKGLGEHKCACESEPIQDLVELPSSCGDGVAEFNLEESTWTLTTSCYSENPKQDFITFEHESICGDFDVVVEQVSTSEDAIGGIMVREDLDANAKFLALGTNGQSQLVWKARYNKGGMLKAHTEDARNKRWLRLVRQGDIFQAYLADEDLNWELVVEEVLGALSCMKVGLWVENQEDGQLAGAVFSDMIWQRNSYSQMVQQEEPILKTIETNPLRQIEFSLPAFDEPK